MRPLPPAGAVDFLSVSRMEKPCPTSPVRTWLTPSVPFRMVRFDPAMPWAAAAESAGRTSTIRLAAISSWFPLASDAARALLAAAWASALVRSA